MPDNLTRKIIAAHLADGQHKPGEEISLRIDQGLVQDTTGTMTFLQLEELGIDRIKIPFAIVYVDHNILAVDFKNPDDHVFLRTFAQRHGIHYSRPGTVVSAAADQGSPRESHNVVIAGDDAVKTAKEATKTP